MSIIATCGHRLRDDEGEDEDGTGWALSIKAYAKDWSHAVHWVTYCGLCKQMVESEGIVLASHDEEMAWLNGSSPLNLS